MVTGGDIWSSTTENLFTRRGLRTGERFAKSTTSWADRELPTNAANNGVGVDTSKFYGWPVNTSSPSSVLSSP
ncbi:hypothetical protein AND_004240 [Anopheles darlingi]|uniref:Uncharacterized protein n=1 Tax=Anopheles darlingi TaxID=43151 RepID=W5JMA6_ANODA|nr:hypothetical protein AND_004240 [Anopheles darlingi]